MSKLQMVDLAGSERLVGNHLPNQKHLKESININKSLFILRKVITQLVDGVSKDSYIPYRESKLTSLLN